MKYRRKPVTVEAFQFTDDVDMIAPEWFTQAVVEEKVSIDRSLSDGHMHVYGCTVSIPCGKLHARLGDYIIRSPDDELYPCRPDVFRRMYERPGKKG